MNSIGGVDASQEEGTSPGTYQYEEKEEEVGTGLVAWREPGDPASRFPRTRETRRSERGSPPRTLRGRARYGSRSVSRARTSLLCADDYGASRKQYEAPKVGDRALQFRTRQNVILELGFFYGKLGW